MADEKDWEAMCLACDPFEGDQDGCGDSDRVLSDKIVTNRCGGKCFLCQGECLPKTKNRVRVEVYDGDLMRFRWCEPCCIAMAVYPENELPLDQQIELGRIRSAPAPDGARSDGGL